MRAMMMEAAETGMEVATAEGSGSQEGLSLIAI